MDGDMDSASSDLADALSDLVRLMTDHQIVNGAKARQVADYRSGSSKVKQADVRALVARAKENHFAFRHAGAKRDIDEAIALLSGRPLDRETGPVALDAYLSKAMIAVSKGDSAGADEGLSLALTVDPLLDLEDRDYPPSLKERMSDLRKRMGEQGLGSVIVKSRPAAAEVYLNGIMRGVTPLELSGLPAREYALVVTANRYAPDERSVTVLPGQAVRIKSKLEWARDFGGVAGESMSGSDVRGALDMAELLKVDRVVMVDADAGAEGSLAISAQVVDRGLRIGFKPLVLPEVMPEFKHNRLAELANMLVEQLGADPLENPTELIDPVGEGDPIMLGKRKKPIVKQPLFWGILGTIAAGAIAGGIAASMSGGSSTGDLKVSFK